MDYLKKAKEIELAMLEINKVMYGSPLVSEMISRKEEDKKKYYARINYNLILNGTTKLIFDDIDYTPFAEKNNV